MAGLLASLLGDAVVYFFLDLSTPSLSNNIRPVIWIRFC